MSPALDLAERRCDDGEPESLVPYFERLRARSEAVLETWPFARMDLDTTTLDEVLCAARIEERLAASLHPR